LLDEIAGMPCEACLYHAPVDRDEGMLTDRDLIASRLAGLQAKVDLLVERVDRVDALLSQATITFPADSSNVEG
jgi:hypothetical protein